MLCLPWPARRRKNASESWHKISSVSPPVASVRPVLASMPVCVLKKDTVHTYVFVCLYVNISALVFETHFSSHFSDKYSSASQLVALCIGRDGVRSCDLKQGFQEHVHTSLVLRVTCLDTCLSLLAKGKVTHRRRDERQQTAWFKYRPAWTNKGEQGEETEEDMNGCHVPMRRRGNNS